LYKKKSLPKNERDNTVLIIALSLIFFYLTIKLELAPSQMGVAKVSKGLIPPPFLISVKELYQI